jgi:hypothetical protein
MLHSKAGTHNVWRVTDYSKEATQGRAKPLNPAALRPRLLNPAQPPPWEEEERAPENYPFASILKRLTPFPTDAGR